ncbi:MAG: hypothetical protein ACTS1X_11425 [Parasphingopyxis sp.]|uniref:hypothetical protein n=1 Tax=Parasphingopyxis sp. TaxID=1920299 RepID=UPI003F9F272D
MPMDEIDVAAATGMDGPAGRETADDRGAPVHEDRTFELPGSIWAMMLLSYAVFFAALAIAVGGTFDAVGMVVISVCFAIMYFGTAAVMTRMAKAHRRADRGAGRPSTEIETLTGPLDYRAAAAQILSVPALFAFFAVCVAVIAGFTLPG